MLSPQQTAVAPEMLVDPRRTEPCLFILLSSGVFIWHPAYIRVSRLIR